MVNAIFDTSRLNVDGEGVQDFFWPVSRAEVLSVRDSFIEGSWAFLKPEIASDNGARLLALLSSTVPEIVGAYQVQALSRRSQSLGRKPIFSPKSAMAAAVSRGWIPEASRSYQFLSHGLSRAPAWKTALRAARSRLRNDKICQEVSAFVNWKKSIVTVATGPMINEHAAAVGGVAYIPLSNWFYPLRQEDKKTYTGGVRSGLIDGLMDVVTQAFAVGNEPVLGPTAQYLSFRFIKLANIADRYLGRILTRPASIPRKLWRGTGGLIFSRLLSLACQENGGYVTGHDHAQGQGLWSSFNGTIIELPFANQFMVYSSRQQEFAKRDFRLDLYPSNVAPRIDVLSVKPFSAPALQRRRSVEPHNTVMYVGTDYKNDFVNFLPKYAGPVLLDWELRTVSRLINWGYKVIIQPHPELVTKISEPFERLGAKVLDGRFENVMGEADIFLFPVAHTTTFFHAIQADVPIVLPSFPVDPWQPEVLALLRRRCAFAAAWLDADNRLQMDWKELKSAIEVAPRLHCADFGRQMFG